MSFFFSPNRYCFLLQGLLVLRAVRSCLFAKHRVLASFKFLAKQTASSSICDQNYVYLLKWSVKISILSRDSCDMPVWLGHFLPSATPSVSLWLFSRGYSRDPCHQIFVRSLRAHTRGENCEHLPLIFIPSRNAMRLWKHSYGSGNRWNLQWQRWISSFVNV